MHKADDCIFCKIIAGDIPSSKVYENEHVAAFLDISQVTKGHTLVIPKTHIENVYEFTPELSKEYFEAVPKIARAIRDEFEPIGLNILNNNGEKRANRCSIFTCISFRVTEKATVSGLSGSPTPKTIRLTIFRRSLQPSENGLPHLKDEVFLRPETQNT